MPGRDHPHTLIRELLTDQRKTCIEELRFIDTDNLHIRGQQEQIATVGYGRAADGRRIMTYHIGLRIPCIHAGFEDLNALFRKFCTAQSADQFLGLSGEHAAAYHFDPTLPLRVYSGVLQEHGRTCKEVLNGTLFARCRENRDLREGAYIHFRYISWAHRMAKDNKYRKINEILLALTESERLLSAGALGLEGLESACGNARELFERLVVLRHKARESALKVSPSPVVEAGPTVVVPKVEEVERPLRLDTRPPEVSQRQTSLIDAIEAP